MLSPTNTRRMLGSYERIARELSFLFLALSSPSLSLSHTNTHTHTYTCTPPPQMSGEHRGASCLARLGRFPADGRFLVGKNAVSTCRSPSSGESSPPPPTIKYPLHLHGQSRWQPGITNQTINQSKKWLSP